MAATRQLWHEFKAFAFKGNLIDLAVAVVIGNAFTGVTTALVKNVLMPTLSYVIPNEAGYRAWQIGRIEVGAFLGELFNFLVVAAVMFLLIQKLMASVSQAVLPAQPGEPATKECPLCLSVIPARAVKCSHCTADLPAAPAAPSAPA